MTHVLCVTEDSGAFRSLFAAVEGQGDRAGWLDLEQDVEGAPPALASTLRDGAWKAVAVERGRTVTVKSRRGPASLRDLLREHFRGCRLVLVRGRAPAPELRSLGPDWELRGDGGERRRLTTEELLRALRCPHLPI